jgi:NADPH:quinone reductase-like Zn-dependent oxidoreductase
MKAALFHRYGPPEVIQIEDVEKPVPKDNEVLVRVHASTVCTADWRVRSAEPFLVRFFAGLWKPRSNKLGMECAGTVESVGKAVSQFHPGDPVFGSASGANAEFACARDESLAIKPASMTFEEATTVMFGGLSALHFLRKAGVGPGQRVLIYGASGSVGVFSVQLAKQFGAQVTGVCSTANVEMVKSLGADQVVDYTKEDFSRTGRVFDVVFDTVGKGGVWRSMKALKRGGVYVREDPAWMLSMPFVSLWFLLTGAGRLIGGIVRPQPGDLAFLKGLIEAGKLRTVIDKSYSFDQIAEAHRHAQSGHKKGHVVLLVQPAGR